MAIKPNTTDKASKKAKTSKPTTINLLDFIAELSTLREKLDPTVSTSLSGNDALNVLEALSFLFVFDYKDDEIKDVEVSFYNLLKRWQKAIKLNENLLADSENVEKSGKLLRMGGKQTNASYKADALKAKVKASENGKHQALSLSLNGGIKMLESYVMSNAKCSNIEVK